MCVNRNEKECGCVVEYDNYSIKIRYFYCYEHKKTNQRRNKQDNETDKRKPQCYKNKKKGKTKMKYYKHIPEKHGLEASVYISPNKPLDDVIEQIEAIKKICNISFWFIVF